MIKLNTPVSDLHKQCIHSQICSIRNNDFIYRKSYQGDWGDWDDAPENLNITTFDITDRTAVSESHESTSSL